MGTKLKDTCASPPFTNVCVPVAAYAFRSYPPCFPLSQRILRPTRRVFSHPSLISSSSPNSRACYVSNVRGEGFEDVHGHVPRKHLEQLHCVSSVPLHPNASHVSRSRAVSHQNLPRRRHPKAAHATPTCTATCTGGPNQAAAAAALLGLPVHVGAGVRVIR